MRRTTGRSLIPLVLVCGAFLVSGAPSAFAGHGPWTFGGDLFAQKATTANGGPVPGKVAEECVVPGDHSTCGRGMFGGANRLGTVLLNSLDEAATSPFACPASATSRLPRGGTTTDRTSTAAPRALVFLPGTYVGGKNASGNTSGETECYDAYNQSSPSAATPGINQLGRTWQAAPTDSCADATSCVRRTYGVAFYVRDSGAVPARPCDGKVVYAGGEIEGATGGNSFKSTEYYDPHPTFRGVVNPNFNTWGPGPAMTFDRQTSTWVKLANGRILMAGGQKGSGDTGAELDTYELFDPTTCSFLDTSGSRMTQARSYHGMGVFGAGTPLAGQVLACGGWASFNAGRALKSCEVFNPGAGPVGTWTPSGNLSVERGSPGFAVLPNGRILFAGGAQSNFAATNLDSEECAGAAGPVITCDQNPRKMNGTAGTDSHIYPSVVRVGKDITGATTSAYKGLVLLCSGFRGSRLCDYYVPSGKAVPVGLTCVGGVRLGPAWCNGPGTLMRRERADFLLQELPSGGTVSTPGRVTAMGGTYGVDSQGNYLTRKNVEYLDVEK